MERAPSPKRQRLEEDPDSEQEGETSNGNSDMAVAASKARILLALCGSFSPITHLHLRMLGRWLQYRRQLPTNVLIFLTELARDCLQRTGKYVVERGVISCVHDAYGKKVKILVQ